MKGKSLVDVVAEITGTVPTKEEAMEFAYNQYGVLASYLRGEFVKKMRSEKKQPLMSLTEKGYQK